MSPRTYFAALGAIGGGLVVVASFQALKPDAPAQAATLAPGEWVFTPGAPGRAWEVPALENQADGARVTVTAWRDPETGCEYLVARSGAGAAITPRLDVGSGGACKHG